jgi:hypothetical protein
MEKTPMAMLMTRRSAVMVLPLLAAAGPPAQAQQGAAANGRGVAPRGLAQRLDFEDAAIGGPPPGFSVAWTGGGPPVRWAVLEDPSSPAGPRVLAETTRDRTGGRFSLAVLDNVTARDVAVSVRFRPVSGTVDQAAGLMVRVRDPRNYYIARANALENNVRLYHVVDGRRTQLAGVDLQVPRDRWQTLALRVEGDRLTVSLEGRELFTSRDPTFAAPGRVGLWTKADSLTHFDDMQVQPLQ